MSNQGVEASLRGVEQPANAPPIDHGSLAGLADDDHLQYLLLVGRVGGQFAYGGTVAGDILDLQGANNSPDVGIVRINSPVTFTYDVDSNTTPAEPYVQRWAPPATDYPNFVGGFLTTAPDMTATGAVFIPATFSDNSIIRFAANPGFAAFTFINELATVQNDGNFNLFSALIVNVGIVHSRITSGTSTTPGTTGFNVAAQTRATVSGAVMTRTTGVTGMIISPTFSTVLGSTVNLGTIRGIQFNQPAVALFQPQAGVENMTAYYGLDFPNFTFGGAAAAVSVVRSLLNSGTNKYLLDHTGTAQSRHAGVFRLLADFPNGLLTFGASNDISMGWVATNEWFWQFNTPVVTQVRWSSDIINETIFQSLNFGSGSQLKLGFDQYAFGQTGSVGNQVGVFVAPARTVGVAGGWADFLLTQAGNLDLNGFAMSDVSAWVINAISLTLSGGSAGYVSTLTIGGMTTSGLGGADTHAIRHTGRRTGRGVDAFEALEPAALTADVNDYAPATGNSMRQYWYLTTDDLGARNITGIVPQQNEDTQVIINVGTVDNIVLQHQNAGSAAANRIISPTGADYTLGPDESAVLKYDSTATRWRIVVGTGA